MNFDKGNIGVKDGLSIHRQGLYKLPDIVDLNILAASSFIPSVKAPPKSRSPHLLLNVLIALFAASTVPPFFKMFPIFVNT
jgi:hypothetical protein